MKIQWLVIFCFIAIINCQAQESNTWGTISRTINARAYAGKNFTIQIAAKVIALKPGTRAGMWVSVGKENKKNGFYKNMSDNPIIGEEWKRYSLSGKIDQAAAYLSMGFGYSDPGIFYFDDFKLLVENNAGILEEVPLVNAGLEEDSITSKYSWWYNKTKSQYIVSLDTNDVFSGKQSCKVDGSALAAVKAYGNNDSVGRYTDVNGIKIYYETYGKGEPLLLLHGNSSSIRIFEKQIPELSKHFKVIAVDTRGQGKSSEDGKTYTYDLFAADMNALLDQLQLDSVNIVGWSDGGNTGLIMAMQYPVKVKKLVTMGANIFIDPTVVEKWVLTSLYKEKKELANTTGSSDKNRLRLIELLLTQPKHQFEELKIIKCPVLIIAGENDVIKVQHTRSIAAAIKGSTLMIVAKATHYFPIENAPAFNKAVINFLQ
jgi:pimeloyl-ACP methyl ester carboxylesterase